MVNAWRYVYVLTFVATALFAWSVGYIIAGPVASYVMVAVIYAVYGLTNVIICSSYRISAKTAFKLTTLWLPALFSGRVLEFVLSD